MESPADVADALEEVASKLRAADALEAHPDTRGNIRDENGNTVGGWTTGADGLELLAEWFPD